MTLRRPWGHNQQHKELCSSTNTTAGKGGGLADFKRLKTQYESTSTSGAYLDPDLDKPATKRFMDSQETLNLDQILDIGDYYDIEVIFISFRNTY